jgi:hypothetical protein
MAPGGLRDVSTNERISYLCEYPSVETREDLGCASQPRRRESIQAPPGPTRRRGINGFPTADEPTGRLESKEYGIQGARSDAAALMDIRAGQLIRWVLQERLQDAQRL